MKSTYRYLLAWAALACLVFAPSYARAAASSATTIVSADVVMNTPTSGPLYVQGNSLGVKVISPSGQTLGWTNASDIQGNGPVQISQNNVDSAYAGYASVVPIRALNIGPGVFTSLSAATVLNAPDNTFNQAGATGSYLRLSAAVDGVDWAGGIATPANAAPFGTVLCAINVSGGGQNINVLDNAIAGQGLHVSDTSIVVGFLDTICFIYDNSGWMELTHAGNYQFSGGHHGGGRVIKTTDATVTALMRWPKGGVTTPGIGFTCDVSAQLTSGTGTTAAYWQGVRATWDGGSNLLASSKGTASGTNAGAPPASWDLSFTTGATFEQLNVIGVAATNINWHANNCATIAPPF